MTQLTQLNSWNLLQQNAELFLGKNSTNSLTRKNFIIQHQGISLDFSHQNMNADTYQLLVGLAEERNLTS